MPVKTKKRQVTNRRRTTVVRNRPPQAPPRIRTGPADNAPAAEVKATPSVNSYTKALRYLGGLTDHERLRIVRYTNQNFDLERMRSLLKKLGNPQDEFKSVHIAGTKGKGSTCAMIAAMLQSCGHKVGLYTSPHLCDIRERIQINGDMIGHAEFARLIRIVAPHVNRMNP